MQLKDFLFEKRDGIALVTFNRPEKLNACRVSTYDEMVSILGDIQDDSAVRVVVITGAGRAFCAGDDLTEMDALVQGRPSLDKWRELAETLQEITRRVVALPQPVIAAARRRAHDLLDARDHISGNCAVRHAHRLPVGINRARLPLWPSLYPFSAVYRLGHCLLSSLLGGSNRPRRFKSVSS